MRLVGRCHFRRIFQVLLLLCGTLLVCSVLTWQHIHTLAPSNEPSASLPRHVGVHNEWPLAPLEKQAAPKDSPNNFMAAITTILYRPVGSVFDNRFMNQPNNSVINLNPLDFRIFTNETYLKSVKQWRRLRLAMCHGLLVAYANEFVQMKDVVVVRNKFSGRAGGENFKEVMLQPEESEYYTVEYGAFQMPCSQKPDYFFYNNERYNNLMFSLTTHIDPEPVDETISDFYILVIRYEYVNLYHTMTDWYNAFLIMNFFNQTKQSTNILFVDAHPAGSLDPVWPVLFRSVIRLSRLRPRTRFLNLAWNLHGYNSPLSNHFAPGLPHVDEFRKFFVESFGLQKYDTSGKLDCKRVNVLFIWRRNYVAHPRNPTGSISRQINNTRQLVTHLRKAFRNFQIFGIQTERLSMKHQLRHVVQADILIGMHGAGLTHALFLPAHAGVIELQPSYETNTGDHFMALAYWRSLHYQRWSNFDYSLEINNTSTHVPPEVVENLVRNILQSMNCTAARTESFFKWPTNDVRP